jgi:hypothetical protein
MPHLLSTTLVRAAHVRSFDIRSTGATGWEALQHHDGQVVQQQRYTDWHRVECTLDRFGREIAELREQGWAEMLPPSIVASS